MTPARDGDRSTSDRGSARRRVLEGAAGVVAAGAIGTTGSVGARTNDPNGETDERTAASRNTDELPLFDGHVHLIPEETLGRVPLGANQLIAWMDENGIDRAVVLALDSPESYPVPASSPWVLDQVDAYPERLLPFCTIDPRTLVYGEDAAENLLERYVERGARGFGELKAGVPIDDPRVERLYELCAEHELPILFHTDEKAMTDDVGLPGLEDVVASFPEVDFLAHAHGWWAHVAADVEEADLGEYPDGEIDEPGRVPELLGRYDNLYGDLSGISGWNALTRDPAFGQAFLETHADQLVFGTDFLHPEQAIPQLELFERFDLDRSARAAIRYENLASVLA
ncbi:amidohydrolase family protein [Natronococcus occultus]|uniref:Putative TIM-barrel fold metal-dependent hydrolase n=1 Tax=Natronococcus occultus SP4 TaxID=694430 RepID=L0JZG3_9EURY|nr:amidohydrolase family protein [Natronococcus occultus]AGB37690.1 putative TIM-barrel fold metal-dependent hydrolase [Natronococcus occultus SP4]